MSIFLIIYIISVVNLYFILKVLKCFPVDILNLYHQLYFITTLKFFEPIFKFKKDLKTYIIIIFLFVPIFNFAFPMAIAANVAHFAFA